MCSTKTKCSSPQAASCGSWFSRDGVSLVAVAKQRPMAAAPIVSLQKVLEKCEPTITHSAVMGTEAFISFHLNQDGASTMLTHVGIYPCDTSCKMCGSCRSIRICKMMFLTAAQNRCIKSMPKNGTCPG